MTNKECQDIFARLSEYLDQELPGDVCRQFEAHIGSCSPCVEFVESLKKSIALSRRFELGQQPRPLQEDEREQLTEAYQRLRQSLQR
jgi:anti-sigma factor RsiW